MEERTKSTSNSRQKRQRALERQRRKKIFMIQVGVLAISIICLIILAIAIGIKFKKSSSSNDTANSANATSTTQGTESENTAVSTNQEIITQAQTLAAGYDYDGAISLLKSVPNYENDSQIPSMISELEQTKASCVAVDVTTVPHLFYHSLINNTDKVFDGDYKEADYNCWYATISEFDKITQQMYDNGWVLVRLRDLVVQTTDADGTVHFTQNTQLMLPPDKKAYVLSVDDLSYYHFGEDDGFPDKIVVDENGLPKCQVTNDDGSIDIGDYDVVPRMNTFLTEHPDGAYKGARGLIALTGYNGILGYRTDGTYKTLEDLDLDQSQWLEAHPDFNWDSECQKATKAAQAIKDSGWEFASHTWGHARAGTRSCESLIEDNQKWMTYVSPLIGTIDTIIFAHGEDIAGIEDYTEANDKYAYYKSQGFNFYCNVDSNCWQQITDSYVRQGRLDIDGYMLYRSMTETGIFDPYFNASEVFDSIRPTPVELVG